MRILVSGSRDYTDSEAFDRVVREAIGAVPLREVTILSGAAKGLDRVAENWAAKHGVKVERYPADWNGLGSDAGGVRNQVMIDRGADLLLAFPLPGSRGTWDCVRRAKKAGMKTQVIREGGEPEQSGDDLLFDWG